MPLTVQPHRETLGLKDGRLLIGGEFREADETWTHHHPATGEEIGQAPNRNAAVRMAHAADRGEQEQPHLVLELDQHRSFARIVAGRLLNINMLSGLKGITRTGRMPMIGREKHHCIHLLIIMNAADIVLQSGSVAQRR